MADISPSLYSWSTTRGSNAPTGGTTIGTGLDDNLREIQGTVRGWLASKGADITAGATCDIGSIEGLYHDITGTTTITSFGTVASGISKVLQFDGATPITHNATSLILPGGASLTMAAGNMMGLTSEGSGNWRVNWITKADGTPLVNAPVGLVLIQRQTPSAVAVCDFTTGISATYDEYLFTFTELIPATAGAGLWCRFSQDAGSTFKAGGTDYNYAGQFIGDVSAVTAVQSINAGQILLASAVHNNALKGLCGEMRLFAPSSTTAHKKVIFENTHGDGTTDEVRFQNGAGLMKLNTSAVNAIRFMFSTGNITSGSIALYGIAKA